MGTKGLGEFVSAVILFDETPLQRNGEGTALPEPAARQGIVPGAKIDAGKGPLALAPGDEVTHGLDGLPKRLEGYKKSEARFAKWRAVYNVSATLPAVPRSPRTRLRWRAMPRSARNWARCRSSSPRC